MFVIYLITYAIMLFIKCLTCIYIYIAYNYNTHARTHTRTHAHTHTHARARVLCVILSIIYLNNRTIVSSQKYGNFYFF